MSFRELCYSMREIIWLSAIGCLLVAASFSSVDHSWTNTMMWIITALTVIWGFWASFPPDDPPSK